MISIATVQLQILMIEENQKNKVRIHIIIALLKNLAMALSTSPIGKDVKKSVA